MEGDWPWRGNGAAATDSAAATASRQRAEDLLLLLLRQSDVLLLHGLEVLHQVLETLPAMCEKQQLATVLFLVVELKPSLYVVGAKV